jgi:hypothetical protein
LKNENTILKFNSNNITSQISKLLIYLREKVINIASINISKNQSNDESLCLISLDGSISSNIADVLKSNYDITQINF